MPPDQKSAKVWPTMALALLSFFWVITSGCSQWPPNKKKNSANPDEVASQAEAMDVWHPEVWPDANDFIYATIDPTSSPWHAEIHRLHFPSLEQSLVASLKAESGDPSLFSLGSEVLLFNRSAESFNFRCLYPKPEANEAAKFSFASPSARMPLREISELTATTQQSFPGGTIGDPHDALALDAQHILLAHYNNGTLSIMDKDSGKETAQVAAAWDLPSAIPLKPEALIPVKSGDHALVYVLHQGLSSSDGATHADGSQKIFVLEWQDQELRPVDLDPALPGIQGIALRGSVPVVVRNTNNQKVVFVSMCASFVAPGNSDATTCHSAVEEVDPSNHQARTLWDLDTSGLKMNGPITAGADTDTLFVNAEYTPKDGASTKVVVKMAIAQQKFEVIHTFAAESGGFWATFFHRASKTLFIGDSDTTTPGKWLAVADDGSTKTIPLTGAPYSGAWLYARAQ